MSWPVDIISKWNRFYKKRKAKATVPPPAEARGFPQLKQFIMKANLGVGPLFILALSACQNTAASLQSRKKFANPDDDVFAWPDTFGARLDS